jgi:hypothetical protein
VWRRLALRGRDGAPLLNLAALTVRSRSSTYSERKIELGNIALTSPEVFVRRDKSGEVNWMSVRPQTDTTEPREAQTSSEAALSLSVGEVAVHDGVVHFDDRLPASGLRSDLSAIQASLRQFTLPQKAPAQADIAFHTSLGEAVKIAGDGADRAAQLRGRVEISKVKLKSYEPYYRDLLTYSVEDGTADLSAKYAFARAADGVKLRLSELDLALASLRLRKPGTQEDVVRAKSAQIRNADIDFDKTTLTAGQLTLREGSLNLIRGPDGVLNVTRIAAPSKTASPQGGQHSPWQIALQRAEVEKWKIAFTDLATKQPVKLVIDDLRLSATGFGTRKGSKGQMSLQARFKDSGAIKVTGPFAINPVEAQLNVEVERFGLVPLQPYFTDKVNLLLSNGDLSVKGATRVALAADGAVSASFSGDVTLADVASVDKAKSEDLLKWRSLYLSGVQYQYAPMTLSIDQVALSDFYARIIVFPDGRLNLQNITAKTEGGSDSDKAGTPAPPDNAAGPKPSPATSSTATTPPMKIGKVVLQGGDVAFTDLFIKPNYSADLSDIGGSVTGCPRSSTPMRTSC